MKTKAHGGRRRGRKVREKRIRDELESLDFQTDLADDSIGEKVEEIPESVSPLLVRPEKERNGRIWKETAAAAALGFRPEEDDGSDRWAPPVSGSEGGLGRLGPRERERGFGPTFGPKPKETF